ncbi:flagellar type III secretion system pore protein FliP [Niameybacter massiliensis]|uniref:Flagellar biosynthetic protein FliP n=2 Tax=Holtiella tumoricola TaxID=3018743 RepID=A0AA42J1V8_9FIRM|nr:flagellar type III secretion system pore protein FliP [Holtiella tumoricola]MDA3732601.1 flagellar type III secretion system pore protein FliP [Holtiella tumoricola]
MIIGMCCFEATHLYASSVSLPSISLEVGTADSPLELSQSLQMLFILTILALAPSILIMMTSFTRIIISLHFLKSAMGTQQMPPNQVIIGLALFLTFFVMSPVATQINETALKPYEAKQITQEEAVERGLVPIKEFMLRQTRDEDIKLFMDLSGREPLATDAQIAQELPMHVIVPAFMISELRAGFIIGFLIYIPFIVMDMVVASTLMSMGMMMLPPATIALPFKILLFILVDGWNLLIGQLIQTFR